MYKQVFLVIASLTLFGCAGAGQNNSSHIDEYEIRAKVIEYKKNIMVGYYNARYDFLVSHYREFTTSDEKRINDEFLRHINLLHKMLDLGMASKKEVDESMLDYIEHNTSFEEFDFYDARNKYLIKYRMEGDKLHSDLKKKYDVVVDYLGRMVDLEIIEPLYAFQQINELVFWQKMLISGNNLNASP